MRVNFCVFSSPFFLQAIVIVSFKCVSSSKQQAAPALSDRSGIYCNFPSQFMVECVECVAQKKTKITHKTQGHQRHLLPLQNFK